MSRGAARTLPNRPDEVTVRVPATSANVGVGFDVLGLALDLTANFMFQRADRLEILGGIPRFRNQNNLVWTSYLTACHALEAVPSPLRIGIYSPLPESGGLGSSSTCVVAGIAAAQILAGRSLDREFTLDLASRIEGHPDNVAPAILGGLVSSFVEGNETTSLKWHVASNLRFVAIAPPYQVLTSEARKRIPATVPTSTAVWQVGRCVAMIKALELGDADLIRKCCHDKLHEPYRAQLIADYKPLRERAMDAGACAFVISGSGSTMLAIADGDEIATEVANAVDDGSIEGLWVRTLRASAFGTSVEVG